MVRGCAEVFLLDVGDFAAQEALRGLHASLHSHSKAEAAQLANFQFYCFYTRNAPFPNPAVNANLFHPLQSNVCFTFPVVMDQRQWNTIKLSTQTIV